MYYAHKINVARNEVRGRKSRRGRGRVKGKEKQTHLLGLMPRAKNSI